VIGGKGETDPVDVQTFLTILMVLVGVLGLFWLGFQIPPRPFRPHPAPTQIGEAQAIPEDLPEVARRHFTLALGEAPPGIETAVVWGRGQAYVRGLWVPMRFKTWYRVGDAFYRRMELTWFRRPVLRGVETWTGEEGFFNLGDRSERGEETNQRELMVLWAEALWMPTALVNHPHIHWEEVDEQTAKVIFEQAGRSGSFLAHFEPLTGRMTHLSGQGYVAETGEVEPWRLDLHEWKTFHGLLLPWRTAVASGESGTPVWYWTVDGVAYNVNVSDQLG